MRHHGFSHSSLYKVTSKQAPRNLLIDDHGVFRNSLFTPDRLLIGEGESIIEGRTITGIGEHDLNNAGDVAFLADFDGTGGLIVNNTIVAELSTGIIGAGGIGPPSLNDKREVAFAAILQDRTRALVLALPVTSFATFTATLDLRLASRINDAFDLESSFTLGAASDGIDPLTEEVKLELTGGTGSFTTIVPAGSFTQDNRGRFTFRGTVDGVRLDARLIPLGGKAYTLTAAGQRVDLSGIANPVMVTLTIGDDSGTDTVTATVRGQEQRANNVP